MMLCTSWRREAVFYIHNFVEKVVIPILPKDQYITIHDRAVSNTEYEIYFGRWKQNTRQSYNIMSIILKCQAINKTARNSIKCRCRPETFAEDLNLNDKYEIAITKIMLILACWYAALANIHTIINKKHDPASNKVCIAFNPNQLCIQFDPEYEYSFWTEQKYTPWDFPLLQKLTENTWREIAKLSPLLSLTLHKSSEIMQIPPTAEPDYDYRHRWRCWDQMPLTPIFQKQIIVLAITAVIANIESNTEKLSRSPDKIPRYRGILEASNEQLIAIVRDLEAGL